MASRAISEREIPGIVVSAMQALVKCGVSMVSIALAYAIRRGAIPRIAVSVRLYGAGCRCREKDREFPDNSFFVALAGEEQKSIARQALVTDIVTEPRALCGTLCAQHVEHWRTSTNHCSGLRSPIIVGMNSDTVG